MNIGASDAARAAPRIVSPVFEKHHFNAARALPTCSTNASPPSPSRTLHR